MSRRIFNLEHDIRLTSWVIEKVQDDIYAQNFYAALCNNKFMPKDVWSILSNLTWSCSWRYAAGLMAELREYKNENYMDWYCSGMGGLTGLDVIPGYVPEGEITKEISYDLDKIDWIVIITD